MVNRHVVPTRRYEPGRLRLTGRSGHRSTHVPPLLRPGAPWHLLHFHLERIHDVYGERIVPEPGHRPDPEG